MEFYMSNFKFTPKKGVIANVTAFVKASTATAALTAANGLALAQTLNKSITDGLRVAEVAEEMAMNNAANFLSEQLGKEISIKDIREGDLSELVEEANAYNRAYAAKKGQYRITKKQLKLNKKLDKLNRKIAALKEEQK